MKKGLLYHNQQKQGKLVTLRSATSGLEGPLDNVDNQQPRSNSVHGEEGQSSSSRIEQGKHGQGNHKTSLTSSADGQQGVSPKGLEIINPADTFSKKDN